MHYRLQYLSQNRKITLITGHGPCNGGPLAVVTHFTDQDRGMFRTSRQLRAALTSLNRLKLYIVQPKRALDQRIARNAHYLDRDQSCLRSCNEISQQFPPAAGCSAGLGHSPIPDYRNNLAPQSRARWR
jgi:hypothetical protein